MNCNFFFLGGGVFLLFMLSRHLEKKTVPEVPYGFQNSVVCDTKHKAK